MFGLLLGLFSLAAVVVADPAWSVSPFSPPSIPLAVRSPYLSAWLPQGPGKALNAEWPTFSDGTVLGFAGYIRVDSKVYNWLGNPGLAGAEKAVQTSMQFTSTQSIFVLKCGPVDLTATFLSPVEPMDLVNQSIPFSYVGLSVSPNDSGSHSVQIYADISGEWLGGTSLPMEWSATADTSITYQLKLQTQTMITETKNRAAYGSMFFSTPKITGTTYQTAPDVVTRAAFIANGTLPNTQNNTFRAIGLEWPVFAFAHDLGTIDWKSSGSALFSLGYVRDPVVQYMTAQGPQNRSPLYLTRFTQMKDLIATFLADYPNALARANIFDTKVNTDAAAAVNKDSSASNYAGLVSLSIRQLMGSLEITVSKKADGTYDTDDVMIFMRDGRVNTVDIIYPAWPAFLYLNPAIGKYLLLPHYRFQADGLFPFQYAAHDLGAAYPKAIGSNDTAMPIEESGNQLIMALSYAQRTNDTSIISKYATLFEQWAEYLIPNSLMPQNQLSSDAFSGALANQTNLAIKGIIGIKAASGIWKLLGDDQKSDNYSAIAKSYAAKLVDLSYSSDKSHMMLSYGDNPSWGLMYNLYADKLLGTNVFPDSMYKMQTAFYSGQRTEFAIPLDSRNTYAKSDWQIWTAAIVTDAKLRASMIAVVKTYVSNGLNVDPLPDFYNIAGKSGSLMNRPAVGGHLALLALDLDGNTSPTTNSTGGQDPSEADGASGLPIPGVFYFVLLFIGVLLH